MAEHELNKIVDDDGEVFNLRDSTKQPVADRVTAWGSTPSDTKYPSEKLVKDSLDGKQATLAFDGTYNASTNKAATVSTVTNAIGGLDVSSVGGNGKYISAISETDGKISATATTMDTTPTANSTNAVTSGGVKSALDDKNWFKNKGPSYLQNSNAYYQCISAPTAEFSGLVKLYDVTEFFDGTIVNQNERSVFFGDVSLIRDGGNAGCKYARVCAMIGYNTASSNIILQSDDDNAYPVLVKEDFDRLEPTYTAGAYVITNNVATLDSTRTRSKFAIISCDGHSSFFFNGGFYNPSGYGLSDIKAYIFVDESFNVLGNASGTNFDGYIDVPAGATKLIVHTNSSYYLSVGPTTTSPKYFLAMRYVAGWPAGTIEYFGRFYTRVTASTAYSARPLLLTYVQNLAPTGLTYIPSGYVVQKTATYTTHSAVSDKLSTARKLAVSLSNTSTDTSFNGSADVTNIKTTGTLGVANGGTGKTSVTAGNYLVGNGTSALQEHTPNAAANNMLSALPEWSANPTDGVKLIRRDTGGSASFGQVTFLTVWNYIKDKISSVLGLSTTGYTGNAATATKATQDSDGNAISATYFKSSGNTTLVSGSATKIGTQNGADVKLTLPTIPSGTQLVYDCGTGSTSTTDFDNALAAYNAGKWVIINKDSVIYHCVGAYNSNLRFKTFANESDLLKVRALTWTRGSAPAVGTTLEAALTSQIPDISGKVNKSGDTMSGNLTISKGANQGDTKFVTSRTDTGTTGWFGVGDGGQNHGVYSEKAYANTNNDVDNDTKGWVVRTDENGYSSLTGAVNGLFAKNFGATETLRGMKRFMFGYSLDREADYTHVSATAIIEARLYSAGVSGGSITMLFNASAQGDARSYYRLQVLSSNNWNLNSVCPVLIMQQVSATTKQMLLGFVSGGPTSTTLMTFNYTEVKVLPLNGARKFNWSFKWDTNDFNSNTMTMVKPYVYPRAQIGTAVGDANTPVYVKNDGSFGAASGVDVAVALKDAGRGDVAGTSGHIVKVGYDNSSVPATTPSGTSTYAAGATVGTTKNLVTSYRYDGVAFYKDVDSGNVTVGNSLKWNGYNLAIQNPGSTPAADTIYIF